MKLKITVGKCQAALFMFYNGYNGTRPVIKSVLLKNYQLIIIILKYIQGKLELKLVYKFKNDYIFTGYIDAYWGGDTNDRISYMKN